MGTKACNGQIMNSPGTSVEGSFLSRGAFLQHKSTLQCSTTFLLTWPPASLQKPACFRFAGWQLPRQSGETCSCCRARKS